MNKILKNSFTKVILLLTFSLALFSACGKDNKKEEKKEIKLSYVEWDTEVASTNVVAEVLKDMGYKVKTIPLDNAVMWESVSKGQSDAMVAAWLPGTHKAQYEKYKGKFIDLGENLVGAKIGLAVPAYMKVDSLADLKDEANKKITGIEAGAGVVAAAEKTVEEYPNLKGWKVETSSSGAMTVALGQAIKNNEEIIVTSWSPHWMFAKYDLKYLKDPKGTMGGEESVHTITRLGLDTDMPVAYKVLDNFYWDKSDSEEVMLNINAGMDPVEAARKWINKNKDKVESWKK